MLRDTTPSAFLPAVTTVETGAGMLTLHKPYSNPLLSTPLPLPVSVHRSFTSVGRVLFGKMFLDARES